MSTISELRNAFARLIAHIQWDTVEQGYVGRYINGAWEFEVKGRPHWWWVRIVRGLNDVTISQALNINAVIGRDPTIPVLIGSDIDGNAYILSVRQSAAAEQLAGKAPPSVEAARSETIAARRLLPGLVYPSADLTVRMEPCFYRWGDTDGYYPGGTLDLTGYRPSTPGKACWVKVGIDPTTNALVATKGADHLQVIPLSMADLAAIDFSGKIPSTGVRLVYGQTAFTNAADFVDCRLWLSGTGGGMTGAGFITVTADTVLPNERVLSLGAGLSGYDYGPGYGYDIALSALTLSEEPAPGSGDFVLTFDITTGEPRKTQISDLPGSSASSLTVKEADGTPTISDVSTIVVTNGTLTDDGNGQASLDFGSAATDGSAIHDNESGEIKAITEKASPVSNDLLLIEDSANSYAKRAVKVGNLVGGGAVTVRASSSNYGSSNTASVTVSSNAKAGDLLLIFVGSNYAVSGIPSGWEGTYTSGTWHNAAVYMKVCASGDIGTAINISLTGSEPWNIACVALKGAKGITGISANRATSGTSLSTGLAINAANGDFALYYGSARVGSKTLTFSSGSALLTRSADASLSSTLWTETMSSILATNVLSSPAATNGISAAIVTIRG